jgi:hypothetical protein
MTTDDNRPSIDDNALIRELGRILDARGDVAAYENEQFIAWLEREVTIRDADAERFDAGDVTRTVRRAQARINAARVGARLAVLPLRPRSAGVVGNVKHVARVAADSGCAPWVESLEVAAGAGREIWDEPCEQWVELPASDARGECLALTVAGDSMIPALHPGDVILVNTRMPVARDSIVVARRVDCGYVVKHVTRCGRRTIELSSFNLEYVPFVIDRTPGAIIGVVTALLRE